MVRKNAAFLKKRNLPSQRKKQKNVKYPNHEENRRKHHVFFQLTFLLTFTDIELQLRYYQEESLLILINSYTHWSYTVKVDRKSEKW